MKYGITKLVLGYSPFIEITEDEYKALKIARDFLFEALYLEQKFDLVTEDFIEYEMTLLSYAARHMMFSNLDYMRLQNEVNNINRRLVNLLSACRLYIDHCIHHLSNIYGSETEKVEAVNNQKKAEYDSKLSYRVLEALRNYVQHRGFPVQKVTYNRNRVEEGDNWQILFSVTPYIKTNELQEDEKFKKTVLDELKRLGDEFDIKPLIREFVTSIGNVHKKAREVLKEDIQQWEERIHNCIQKFRAETKSDDIIGLGIAIQEDEGTYSESISIFTDFMEHRHELEDKNRLVGSLARFYVTSQIVK
jgi:hypothetical protein